MKNRYTITVVVNKIDIDYYRKGDIYGRVYNEKFGKDL